MADNEYSRVWVKLCGEEDDHVREMHPNRRRGGQAGEQAIRALGRYKLYCFGERLSKKNACPWVKMQGNASIKLYLINKHHWKRDDVEFIKEEELMYLLHEELLELELNAAESLPIHQWACQDEAWVLLAPHVRPA